MLLPVSSYSMNVEKGKLYFVGVGPSGPDPATLQAIDVIGQAIRHHARELAGQFKKEMCLIYVGSFIEK